MAIEFNHATQLIDISSPQDTLSCQDLIDAIREEEASERGILYDVIATASGKEDLGSGVAVGMTVNLIDPWQVKFWAGNYIAKVAGGNLVGGIAGDPIAYSAGVQVLLVQSAASTIVTVGGDAVTVAIVQQGLSAQGLTSDRVGKIDNIDSTTRFADKVIKNKRVISPGKALIVYDDDDATPILQKTLSDVSGNPISDLAAGILAQEGKTSV